LTKVSKSKGCNNALKLQKTLKIQFKKSGHSRTWFASLSRATRGSNPVKSNKVKQYKNSYQQL